MMFVVLLVFGAVLFGIGAYLYFYLKRAAAAFGADVGRKLVKRVLLATAAVLTLSGMAFGGFVLIILVHLMALDAIIRLIGWIVNKILQKRPLLRWKRVLASGILPLVLTLAVMLGGYYNLHNVVRTDYTVYTEKNIRAEGYRIALVADVHFGVSLDEEELMEKCREIEAQEPDLVILCGDIVDNGTEPLQMQRVFAALGSIKSELGVFYVYGNHDRPMRLMQSDFTEEELKECILSNGITILQDHVLPIGEDLVLVGREDRSAQNRLALSELYKKVDREDFVLVLDHQPNEYKENGALGTDLLLSGHTHGGQLFPIEYLQEIIPFNDGVYGRYTLSNGGVAIITSGFGTWSYPIKTAAPAEYVIIDVLTK